MCMYLNLIEDVVNEYTKDEKMFTAFDVTKEVRVRTKDRVFHDEVKKEVHKMFHNGALPGYNRSLANLANANPQPWVYHPQSVDVSKYNGSPVNDTSTVADPGTTPISSISSFAGSGTNDNDDKVYKLDTTDRLCVPNKLVRQLSLKTGDTIYVYYANVKLTLKKDGSDGNFVTSYQVDKDDNVRITAGTLCKCGLAGTEFDITGDAKCITVEKHT